MTFLLLSLTITLSSGVQAQATIGEDRTALVAIEITSSSDIERFESTGLPAYMRLSGKKLLDYLLVGADTAGQLLLSQVGLVFRSLDPDMDGASYYMAPGMHTGEVDRIELSAYGRILLDDGVQVLLRTTAQRAQALARSGAKLHPLTLDPKPLRAATPALVLPDAIEPDPLIQALIDQVDSNTVYAYTSGLTGDQPVWVAGEWYTITSRNTYSEVSLQKATQWVGGHFANLGLNVEYHQWNGEFPPNVVAELTGSVNPEDIFLIGGHLDDVNGTPGADDNASGSVATLIAADILSHHEWGCTLRFALWTGEEQGSWGSYAYARRAYQEGENILGYLNLDMISYNTIGSSPGIDLLYNPSMPPTLALAELFDDVVNAYDMDLLPELQDSIWGGSDHYPFWNYGYTAILGIEDQGDFNPYYHTSGDTLENQDLPYYTEFIKAAVGTFAHMSDCLIPSRTGYLDGVVSADTSNTPIETASVVAVNGSGNQFSVLTNASGYYTQTLSADTYTVTASAYGYLPLTISDVEVVTDTITTQDFSLMEATSYTVSGTVTESGSGLPLLAEVTFEGTPVNIWTNPSTGFYSATLPAGSYTIHVSAILHATESRMIALEDNLTEDFSLNPLIYLPMIATTSPGGILQGSHTGDHQH